MRHGFLIYLAVMAGVTYLVRMLPMVFVKKQIKNRFFLSFLHYIPYTVLAAMTIPAVFFATSSVISAAVGVAVALVLAFFEKKLLTVACGSCLGVLAVELVLMFIK